VSYLGQLSADDGDALCALGRRRGYPARATILYEGDEPHEVLVVRTGEVKVATSIDGREVVLDVLGAGDLVGELAAIDGRPRSASVVTLTPAEVVVVPTAAFTDFLAERPAAAMCLLRSVAGRLRDTSRRQVEYGALDAVGRVCRRILELAERSGAAVGGTIVVRTPLTQAEVAAWAGLSREAVVKALQSLRRLGWVTTGPGTITVHDIEAVRARAVAG
jgi:CRP/FNR family transcriptional regulator, cyclic AMP receptor protein